jgi:hypothetical protein
VQAKADLANRHGQAIELWSLQVDQLGKALFLKKLAAIPLPVMALARADTAQQREPPVLAKDASFYAGEK